MQLHQRPRPPGARALSIETRASSAGCSGSPLQPARTAPLPRAPPPAPRRPTFRARSSRLAPAPAPPLAAPSVTCTAPSASSRPRSALRARAAPPAAACSRGAPRATCARARAPQACAAVRRTGRGGQGRCAPRPPARKRTAAAAAAAPRRGREKQARLAGAASSDSSTRRSPPISCTTFMRASSVPPSALGPIPEASPPPPPSPPPSSLPPPPPPPPATRRLRRAAMDEGDAHAARGLNLGDPTAPASRCSRARIAASSSLSVSSSVAYVRESAAIRAASYPRVLAAAQLHRRADRGSCPSPPLPSAAWRPAARSAVGGRLERAQRARVLAHQLVDGVPRKRHRLGHAPVGLYRLEQRCLGVGHRLLRAAQQEGRAPSSSRSVSIAQRVAARMRLISSPPSRSGAASARGPRAPSRPAPAAARSPPPCTAAPPRAGKCLPHRRLAAAHRHRRHDLPSSTFF